jgi:hypothetical protein
VRQLPSPRTVNLISALGRKRWLGMAADITKTLSLPSRRRFRKRKALVSENGKGEAGAILSEIVRWGASLCSLIPGSVSAITETKLQSCNCAQQRQMRTAALAINKGGVSKGQARLPAWHAE